MLNLIEKALKCLEKGDTEGAKETLVFARQKQIMSEKGMNVKLATAVKKVLAVNKDERFFYAAVHHDENGKQFVLDGYIMFHWNEYEEQLDALPQQPYIPNKTFDVINYFKYAMQGAEYYSITFAERFILENITKYIKLYKDKNIVPIYLFGKCFDANLIRTLTEVMSTEFDEIWLTKQGVIVRKGSTTGLVMALKEMYENIIERTRCFVGGEVYEENI